VRPKNHDYAHSDYDHNHINLYPGPNYHYVDNFYFHDDEYTLPDYFHNSNHDYHVYIPETNRPDAKSRRGIQKKHIGALQSRLSGNYDRPD
jgi:hypothetical protein